MILLEIKIGYFLAVRQIKRSNLWITALIIFVMMATFLNLVVVSGILVGLIAGSSHDFRAHYSGDILIKPKIENISINNSNSIAEIAASLPDVRALSVRYLHPVKLESDYKSIRKTNQADNAVETLMAGIVPSNEESVTSLADFVVEGEYLSDEDTNQVLIGSSLLDQYSDSLSSNTLKGVKIGSKIRLSIDGVPFDVIVKGIVKIKLGDISQRVFMNQKHFLRLANVRNDNAGEIAIALAPATDPVKIKTELNNSGIDRSALVQTWNESQGKFYKDLSSTFVILGNVIGSIGLAVASITIFIVIFINAISRKKYIGILKGIGVSGGAIRYSYLFQSIFYALVGSLFGLAIIYGLLVPYFAANTIDFPFSDGILAVTYSGVAWRLGLLFLSTLIAGFLPAQIVIRRNTLDSILGR